MNIESIAIHCARELAVGADPDDIVFVDAAPAVAYLEQEYGIAASAWGAISPAAEWVEPEHDPEFDPTALPEECPAMSGVHLVGGVLYVVGTDGMCAGYWRFNRKE